MEVVIASCCTSLIKIRMLFRDGISSVKKCHNDRVEKRATHKTRRQEQIEGIELSNGQG